jgi:hypothetical protein
MKTSVKYRVEVDPEVKKEMERLADYLSMKLEKVTCMTKVTLIVQPGWIPYSQRNFYAKGQKVSVSTKSDNVWWDKEYLDVQVLTSETIVKSAEKLRKRLKDRYPELHQQYEEREA